jgi:hypothetical protein
MVFPHISTMSGISVVNKAPKSFDEIVYGKTSVAKRQNVILNETIGSRMAAYGSQVCVISLFRFLKFKIDRPMSNVLSTVVVVQAQLKKWNCLFHFCCCGRPKSAHFVLITFNINQNDKINIIYTRYLVN